jgi:hypothetical protein
MDLADRLRIRSPRRVVGFLAGRHRLEDGSYQRDVLQIVEGERLEKAGGGRRANGGLTGRDGCQLPHP